MSGSGLAPPNVLQVDIRRRQALKGNPKTFFHYYLRVFLAVAIATCSIAPIFLHNHPVIMSTNNQPLHPFLRSPRSSSHTVKLPKLPSNIGGAGRYLLLRALEKRPVWDEDINPIIEAERCSKYFSYLNNTYSYATYKPTKTKRRRVFLGSLIADDSWHALGALAMETYGIYTAVAFVESNRTQTGSPRNLRFVHGTEEHTILVESNLFGPTTPVLVKQFAHEGKIVGKGLIREQMQRSLIIDMWKKAGMTPDDIGILTDADETPTRDFLRAMQICDIPQLDPITQNCHTAKLIVASMVFEGSPECMTVTRKWMHPDLILGKFIEGIGDEEYKLTDNQRQQKLAWRKKEYTYKYGNYSGWSKDKKTFPLWNPADFRRDQGGHVIMFENVSYLTFGMGHTGYHFHNYFETTTQLRTKYMTYGHPIKDAENMSIGEMHPDLDVMVDCVLGRSSMNNKHNVSSVKLVDFQGRIPIAYDILDGYTSARHVELETILKEDIIGHDRTWHDNPKSKDWFENIPP
jgi:hypothetical protein